MHWNSTTFSRSRRWAMGAVGLVAALVAGSCSMSDPSSVASTVEGSSGPSCQEGSVVDEALMTATTATGTQAARYENDPVAPQSQDCAQMRTFLSTPQPGFDLQSYVFYGHLVDSDGAIIPFSTLTQTQPGAPGLRTAAVTVNTGSGVTIGGMEGVAGAGIDVSTTTNPFSLRTQTSLAGKPPEYIQAQVVEGQLGQAGAVIELQAQITGEALGATPGLVPMQVSVRARDVGGVGQWGYGPSGFFPQWILAPQRSAIESTYDGSVGDYLAGTGDQMLNQGSYYYSSPVLDVEAFTISVNNSLVASGTGGELIADYVTQSFDAAADEVVDNDVQWTEFSTMLDGGRTLKIGEVEQASVGRLPYAVMLSVDGPRGDNAALTASRRWDIGQITITADPESVWTSARSKQSYAMRYVVELAGADADSSASLTYDAVVDDQEIDVAGRTVYEGLYRVTGTLDGESVSGFAWGEIQPTGTLG